MPFEQLLETLQRRMAEKNPASQEGLRLLLDAAATPEQAAGALGALRSARLLRSYASHGAPVEYHAPETAGAAARAALRAGGPARRRRAGGAGARAGRAPQPRAV
jgi:hypothetical protein